MHTITATYKAPAGDSKVTEVFGYTFFDGKPETITVDDRVLGKLKNHAQFTVTEGEAAKPDDYQKPGDPKAKPDDDQDHGKKHK